MHNYEAKVVSITQTKVTQRHNIWLAILYQHLQSFYHKIKGFLLTKSSGTCQQHAYYWTWCDYRRHTVASMGAPVGLERSAPSSCQQSALQVA